MLSETQAQKPITFGNFKPLPIPTCLNESVNRAMAASALQVAHTQNPNDLGNTE